MQDFIPDYSALAAVVLSALMSFAFSRVGRDVHQSSHLATLAARHLQAVQAAHAAPTARLGGFAILIGTMCGLMLSGAGNDFHVAAIAAGALIVFGAGAMEDLGFAVHAVNRLLAAFAAAATTAAMLFLSPSGSVISLETGLEIVVAIGILVFTAGMTNALNLVDGLNGLAVAVTLTSCGSLAWLSFDASQPMMGVMALVIGAAAIGFGFLNFPSGSIFLGDGGAYAIGFVMAWCGAILVLTGTGIAIPAILLILFWPLSETLMTILRRLAAHRPVMSPDFDHSHQLALRALLRLRPELSRETANPRATMLLLPFIVAPPLCGVAFADDAVIATLIGIGFFLLHALSWRIMAGFVGGPAPRSAR